MDATQFLLLCIRAPQAAHVHSSTIAAICGALQQLSSLQLQPPAPASMDLQAGSCAGRGAAGMCVWRERWQVRCGKAVLYGWGG